MLRSQLTGQMNLLQIPIIDEYWVSPQDPAAHHRDPEFAIQSGYGLGFNYNRSAIAA